MEGGRSGSEATAHVLAGPPLGSPVADLAEPSLLIWSGSSFAEWETRHIVLLAGSDHHSTVGN